MITITVARKPLSGSTVVENVLDYGCGSINIDASRVAGKLDKDPSRFSKTAGGSFVANFDSYKPLVRTEGRWPANLLLQHLPGCQFGGTEKIKARYRVAERTPTGKQQSTRITTNLKTGASKGDPDRTETVVVWDCEHGCPVSALDTQSGILTTNGQKSPFNSCAKVRTVYGKYEGSTCQPRETNSGGASRFFKQLKGNS